ncbi:helix-turn-helix domain-containing protein [Kitasatospora sp. NPDC001574]
MGRPEKPIAADAFVELRRLAHHLRKLRADARLSYRQIAEHPDSNSYSVATFQRAAAGVTVPTKEVTIAFAKACGNNADTALRLRREAARAIAWAAERNLPRRVTPGAIFSLTDLRTAMRYAHLQAGRPSSRVLEADAPPGHLPHTTLDRLLDPRKRPRLPSRQLLEAFLSACAVPPPRRKEWMAAYQRLADHPSLGARALARIARTHGDGTPYRPSWQSSQLHDRVEEEALRKERNQQFKAFRKTWKPPDDLDWANDYGTGEDEYIP